MKQPKVDVDLAADAAYVRLSDKPYSYTEEIDDYRNIDRAEDDSVIGVEFLYISKHVEVDDLPESNRILRALEASEQTSGHKFKITA